MNTTLLTGASAGASARAIRNCATISSAASCRWKPSVAVAQKTQWRVQPDWLETQIVLRPRAGISTDLDLHSVEVDEELDRPITAHPAVVHARARELDAAAQARPGLGRDAVNPFGSAVGIRPP